MVQHSQSTRPEASTPILVIGAGSWGTALAVVLARNHQIAYLWGRTPEHVREMRRGRRNTRYLPGVELPALVKPVDDLHAALREVSDLLVVVPMKALRDLAMLLVSVPVVSGVRIAWACKGVESGTHRLAHQVIGEVLGLDFPTAVISGPSFAAEVAAGLPTAVTVASANVSFAADLAARLHGDSFRAYTSADIVGVEVGGAVKNVLAIAAGVADGLGFGANTRAALITRGLAEMIRLGVALGGRRETFMGLAGLGDLVLTCTDDQSRNRRMGLALAKGATVAEAVSAIGPVVEGVRTAGEVRFLAQKHNIEMPITEQVVRLLGGECSPREAVQALLSREPRQELS